MWVADEMPSDLIYWIQQGVKQLKGRKCDNLSSVPYGPEMQNINWNLSF